MSAETEDVDAGGKTKAELDEEGIELLLAAADAFRDGDHHQADKRIMEFRGINHRLKVEHDA